jgi:hypothetical protein
MVCTFYTLVQDILCLMRQLGSDFLYSISDWNNGA